MLTVGARDRDRDGFGIEFGIECSGYLTVFGILLPSSSSWRKGKTGIESIWSRGEVYMAG